MEQEQQAGRVANLELQKLAVCGAKTGVASAQQKRASMKLDQAGYTVIAYSNDKSVLIAGTAKGQVCLWKRVRNAKPNEEAGREALRPFSVVDAHKGAIVCLSQHPTESILFTGSSDRLIKVWDIGAHGSQGLRCVQTLAAHRGTVTSVAAHDNVLFSCSTDNTVKLWRCGDGREQLLYKFYEISSTLRPNHCWMTAVWYAHNIRGVGGSEMYVADSEGRLITFKIHASDHALKVTDEKQWPRKNQLGITMILMSDNVLFAISHDCTMRMFDTQSGFCTCTVSNENKARFSGMAWRASSAELFLCDVAGYVHIWNVMDEMMVRSEQLSTRPIFSIAVDDAKAEIAVVIEDSDIEVWRLVRMYRYVEAKGHTAAVVAITAVSSYWVPGSSGQPPQLESTIYSAGLDQQICAWEPRSMTCKHEWRVRDVEVTCLALFEALHILISGHDDGIVVLWNLNSGSSLRMVNECGDCKPAIGKRPRAVTDPARLKKDKADGSRMCVHGRGHTNTVTCAVVAKCRGSDVLVTGSFDGSIIAWEISREALMLEASVLLVLPVSATSTGEHNEVLCLCYHPTKNRVFVGGNDRVIHVMDIDEQSQTAVLEGHLDAVTALVLDANFLVSASDDMTIKIWDVHAQSALRDLQQHQSSVRSLILVSETGHLVSIGNDNRVLVWDYSKGEVVQEYAHSEELRCITYNSIRQEVVTGTDVGSLLSLPYNNLEQPVAVST